MQHETPGPAHKDVVGSLRRIGHDHHGTGFLIETVDGVKQIGQGVIGFGRGSGAFNLWRVVGSEEVVEGGAAEAGAPGEGDGHGQYYLLRRDKASSKAAASNEGNDGYGEGLDKETWSKEMGPGDS